MNRSQFGFLGCGNMGGALVRAMSQAVECDQIAVYDINSAKMQFPVDSQIYVADSAQEIAAHSRYIFLAVKPQSLSGLFDEIRPVLQERTDRFILVSMAAGTSVSEIERMAGCVCPVIRMMPNTPVSVGEGMILYTANNVATGEDIETFLAGLAKAGRTDRLPESLLDAAGALSGCGPAFVCLFAEALSDGGVECGLPREKAMLYASQTLIGTARLLLESGKHPGQLKDAVCSPGGTTIAGVHALESASFRATVMDAVTAAYVKTAKLNSGK